MKVSIEHSVPGDEFAKRYGMLGSAGYDEAHAALLRAQGIKPVNVSTTYGEGSTPVALQQPVAIAPPTSSTDLGPLYALFIQLADALSETRELINARATDQERVNQVLAQTIDDIVGRFALLGKFAEGKINADAA